MNKGVIFVLGVATGSAVTYFLVKNKFKRIADEEIESVVQTFKKRFDDVSNNENIKEVETEQKVETEKDIYEQNMKDLGYSTITEEEDPDDGYVAQNIVESVVPYIISEDEFNDPENKFDSETLLYYADGVLADDGDDTIDDPENVVGDSLSAFDDPMVETIYVRDKTSEVDYVILRSEKNFSDICMEEDN